MVRLGLGRFGGWWNSGWGCARGNREMWDYPPREHFLGPPPLNFKAELRARKKTHAAVGGAPGFLLLISARHCETRLLKTDFSFRFVFVGFAAGRPLVTRKGYDTHMNLKISN